MRRAGSRSATSGSRARGSSAIASRRASTATKCARRRAAGASVLRRADMDIARDGLFRLLAGAAFSLAWAGRRAIAEEHKPYAVWVIGEGERNGQPIMVRWRDKMPPADVK